MGQKTGEIAPARSEPFRAIMERMVLKGLPAVKTWRRLPRLWDHQARGIQFSERYLNDHTTNKIYAALLRMPTGTGKTGIMAVLSNFLAPSSRILLIAPSSYLTFQLTNALTEKFWKDVGSQPWGGAKPALAFTPNVLTRRIPELKKPFVALGTTQPSQLLFTTF